MRSSGRQGRAAAVAETVLRLAVLLQAGAAPAAAWRHLGESGDADAAAVFARSAEGAPLVEAIEAQGASARRRNDPEAARLASAWRDVAAAWEVSTAVGAPLADSLRGMSHALRDAHESGDDVRVALAEPTGTARLMGWLPLFGLLIGGALGFDTVSVLFADPFGLACLGAGVALLVTARVWTGRLVRAAQPPPSTPGMTAELMAIALAGGVSIDRALGLVHEAPGGPRDTEDVDQVLALSRAAGVPAVELLRASAAHERHDARTSGRMRAARLGARILLPLGVCTLPAFLCLGVAPMMLSVITATPLPVLAE
ncbi:pilus assembly protein TadB [Microbacterium betulae]|uniref:Pilus assembly protein TadB n=1 Tax=Microbacterium betulae TaxID=2981139 RepID=A0AA97I794_9MICO|nr:pilus assembly protein TadB [Microbacterium sp. AB]WOF24704.1 pilus assembly protein TadB [Microbacterium sp. AB]